MKRYLWLAFLFIPALAYCQEKTSPLPPFGGLDTDDHPATLTNKTPDSSNVITDYTQDIRSRLGFTSLSTTTCTGLWEFPVSNGTRYLICQDSTVNILKASKDGQNLTITVSTIAAGIPTVVTSLGDLLFFSNSSDGLKDWDTATVTLIDKTLLFTQLVTHKGRVWGSGNASASRTIYGSKFGDGTNYTLVTDPAPTDPTQIVIGGALDEPLTSIYATFQDKLIWMKAHSFGGIIGDSRNDFRDITYSAKIGTAYPESVKDCDGYLRWIGPSRTVWEFDGSTFTKVSVGIDTLLATVAQGDANSRSLSFTSKADFDSGTLYQTSSNLSPGDVRLSTDNVNLLNPGFESGSGSVATNWTITRSTDVAHSGTHSGQIDPTHGNTLYVVIVFDQNGNVLSNNNIFIAGGSWTQRTLDLSSFPGQLMQVQFLGNGGKSDIFICSGSSLSWWDIAASSGIYVDDFTGGRSDTASGTWVSQNFSLGNVSGFGVFTTNDDKQGETITYAVYTDTNSSHTQTNGVPDLASFTSSQTITSGSIPTLSTGAYAFLGASFSISNSTHIPVLHDISLQWSQGSTIRVAGVYPSQRYWLGVAISSTGNNTVLVFDRSRQWQKYTGINMVAANLYNGNLVFSNNQGTFQGETGYTDNGTAITSYYVTPTMSPSSPNLSTKFDDLTVTSDNSSQSVVMTYEMNGIATDYNLGSYVMNTTGGIQNFRMPFPATQTVQGNNVSFKFSVIGNSFWRLLGATMSYESDTVSK